MGTSQSLRRIRDSGCTDCIANLGQMVKDLHDIRNVEGVGDFWNKGDGARKRLMTQTDSGRWGTVFEILQNGKLQRGEFSIVNDAGETVALKLGRVDEDVILHVDGRGSVRAQFDAWAELPDGRLIGTEFKGGTEAAAGGWDTYDQMERQLAVAQQRANDLPQLYAKELHWRFDKPIQQGAIDNAKALQNLYPDMKIRLFTKTGMEIPIV